MDCSDSAKKLIKKKKKKHTNNFKTDCVGIAPLGQSSGKIIINNHRPKCDSNSFKI